MSILLTGGAGFIGSCLLRQLNDNGIDDIYIVDNIGTTEKWKNLVNKSYREYISKYDFLERCETLIGKIDCIIHMGACSSTTEKNFDYLYKNNVDFSKFLYNYAANENISFLYASSAATYGDGSLGFDDTANIKDLRPLNGYGYSKQLFDIWTERQIKRPLQVVGLKFFNVYGPNENFKGDMSSVVYKAFNQISETGKVRLFKSYVNNIENGGQLRDFVYVKDICKVISFIMEHKEISGIYNVGTGNARSFKDLALATFVSMGVPANIEYIEMPEYLQSKYQYYTCSDMNKLLKTGYNEVFYSLEDGIYDYVNNYLKLGSVY